MTHSQRNAGLIFFAVVLIRLVFHWITGFVADDAFITFRYAENIAAGHGFVYNEGERVLGTATPLFTLILSLFAFVRLGAGWGALLVSVVSSGLTAAILYRYAERLRFGSLWAIPVALYAMWPQAMISETSGTETAFYTFLLTASFYNLQARRPYYALAAATLATVTRPEGALALALVLLASLWRYRDRWLSLVLVPAAILVPWVLFANWYFGSPIPHTIPAGLALYGRTGADTPFARLDYALGLSQGYGWVLVALVLPGVWWLWRTQRTGLILLAWLAGMAVIFAFSELEMIFWYVTPLLPVLFLVASAAAVALFDAVDWLHVRQANLVPPVSLAIVVLLGVINFGNLQVYQDKQAKLTDANEAIGYYLRAHTKEEALVAAEDIGYIGAFSRRHILDRDGLVSPQAVPYNAAGAYGQLIYDFEPDVVVASTQSPISGFIEDSLFTARYEKRRSFYFGPSSSYLVFHRKGETQALTP